MDKSKIDYTLYFVTDRELMHCDSVERCVELAVKGGASVVQLREKDISSRDFYETALRVHEVTKAAGVPLIINDRLDICLAAGAEGVHLGQSDIPCRTAREILGADKIIGVSSHNAEEAAKAQADGADYLGVGAVFTTSTKTNTTPVTPEIIREVRAAVTVPFVVIGGVNERNIAQLSGLGFNGAAVVSAVAARDDITAAAMEMRKAIQKAL
ncbi:MAG: thiamine phosphate synthase [Oscillospiraceae bacterium]